MDSPLLLEAKTSSEKLVKLNRIEDTLIILLARTSIGSDERHAIEDLLTQEVDWDYFLKTAQNHGVYPLVYTNLRDYPRPGLDEAHAEHFSQNYRMLVALNIAYTYELVSVLRKFEQNNIPAIAIKGPVLTQLVYGDVGLRMISDLDILVPQDKTTAAVQILIQLRLSADLQSG